MTVALMRIFYGIWALGALAFIAMTIGTSVFSYYGWKTRLRRFVKRIFHSIIWPIALLSEKGRNILLTDLEEGQ